MPNYATRNGPRSCPWLLFMYEYQYHCTKTSPANRYRWHRSIFASPRPRPHPINAMRSSIFHVTKLPPRLFGIFHGLTPSVVTRRVGTNIIKSLEAVSMIDEAEKSSNLPFLCRLSAVVTESTQRHSHGTEDILSVHVAAVDPNRSAQVLEESKRVEKHESRWSGSGRINGVELWIRLIRVFSSRRATVPTPQPIPTHSAKRIFITHRRIIGHIGFFSHRLSSSVAKVLSVGTSRVVFLD